MGFRWQCNDRGGVGSSSPLLLRGTEKCSVSLSFLPLILFCLLSFSLFWSFFSHIRWPVWQLWVCHHRTTSALCKPQQGPCMLPLFFLFFSSLHPSSPTKEWETTSYFHLRESLIQTNEISRCWQSWCKLTVIRFDLA